MSHPSDLQVQMIAEFDLIMASVDWLQQEIEDKLKEFEADLAKGDSKKSAKLEKEVLLLLKKLSLEEVNMDIYMVKFKEKINDEKKKMLHNFK
jgi:hypothetical protein